MIHCGKVVGQILSWRLCVGPAVSIVCVKPIVEEIILWSVVEIPKSRMSEDRQTTATYGRFRRNITVGEHHGEKKIRSTSCDDLPHKTPKI